jgi:hypothetical protein
VQGEMRVFRLGLRPAWGIPLILHSLGPDEPMTIFATSPKESKDAVWLKSMRLACDLIQRCRSQSTSTLGPELPFLSIRSSGFCR